MFNCCIYIIKYSLNNNNGIQIENNKSYKRNLQLSKTNLLFLANALPVTGNVKRNPVLASAVHSVTPTTKLSTAKCMSSKATATMSWLRAPIATNINS